MGVQQSKEYVTIENAFKCCCILHNMILDYDRGYHETCFGWENVDWSTVDPDVTDEELGTIVAGAIQGNSIDVLPLLPIPSDLYLYLSIYTHT